MHYKLRYHERRHGRLNAREGRWTRKPLTRAEENRDRQEKRGGKNPYIFMIWLKIFVYLLACSLPHRTRNHCFKLKTKSFVHCKQVTTSQNCSWTSRSSTRYKTRRSSQQRSTRECRTLKSQNNRSIQPEKATAVSLTELHCCFSAFLIWMSLILCMSIRFNGSRNSLKWALRTRLLRRSMNNDLRTWINISRIHCTRTYVDRCSRSISWFSHWCSQCRSYK